MYQRYLLYPADNYMFKVNNRKTRTWCEICSMANLQILKFSLLSLQTGKICKGPDMELKTTKPNNSMDGRI